MGNEITPRFTVVSQKFVKESTMFVNVWYKNLYFNCHKEDWMYNWSMKLVKIYKIKEQYKKMYKNTRFSTPKKLTTPFLCFQKIEWKMKINKTNMPAIFKEVRARWTRLYVQSFWSHEIESMPSLVERNKFIRFHFIRYQSWIIVFYSFSFSRNQGYLTH